MNFEIIREGEIKNGTYLTIGVEGSSSVQINIYIPEKQIIDLDNGRIVTFRLADDYEEQVLAFFMVKVGNIGDLITLNTHITFDNKAPDNLLYPNGPVVMGILDSSENFKKECFPISILTSEKFSNVNKYYLTGKIHSKYALF